MFARNNKASAVNVPTIKIDKKNDVENVVNGHATLGRPGNVHAVMFRTDHGPVFDASSSKAENMSESEVVESSGRSGSSVSSILRNGETSPLSSQRQVRTVKFSGLESSLLGNSENLEDSTEDEFLGGLGKMKESLTQAQISLAAEKTLRKRKETNIIRLAQELDSRTADIEKKKEQIVEVSEIEKMAYLVADCRRLSSSSSCMCG
jgi:hypothetical protein